MGGGPFHRIAGEGVGIVGGGDCAWLPLEVVVQFPRCVGEQAASSLQLLQDGVSAHIQDDRGGAWGEQCTLGKRGG